jgi:hypothetical protein
MLSWLFLSLTCYQLTVHHDQVESRAKTVPHEHGDFLVTAPKRGEITVPRNGAWIGPTEPIHMRRRSSVSNPRAVPRAHSVSR